MCKMLLGGAPSTFPVQSSKMPDNEPCMLKALECFKYLDESICEWPKLPLIAFLPSRISRLHYNDIPIKVKSKIRAH